MCVFPVLEGFLFVVGGTDEHKTILDSGEKYDPDSNAWSPIPSMLQVHPPARRRFSVSVMIHEHVVILFLLFFLNCFRHIH